MHRIRTFKSLMEEIFYDWGFSRNPQINKDEKGFWVNKTSITEFSDEVILSYKTDSSVLEDKVYTEFKEFYEDYKNDEEFEKILTDISNVNGNLDLLIQKDQVKFGDLIFIKNNGYCTYYDAEEMKEISEELYDKVNRFFTKYRG